MHNKTCLNCGSAFITKTSRKLYCTTLCKNQALYKSEFEKKQETLKKGIEGIDYVIDKWNGYATKRIYGKWIATMHPGKTTADYLREFPGSPLTCENDKNATTKNSGLHMKDPKYRKMASDAIKGSKNPNHKTKTSEEIRKSRSPFSKNFKRYNTEEERKEFLKSIDWSNRITSTQLDWWLNKGYSPEEAQQLLKKRQATFTLDKCIQKWGEEEGGRVFHERQTKWSNKVETKYRNGDFNRFCKHNWSKTEETFIKELVKVLSLDDDEYYSAINGKQFYRNFKEVGKTLAYDFVYKKKIIEFNGDYWHCNPKIYEAEYFNKSLQCTAKEKWEFDKCKNVLIENYGYDVLTIWEMDWNMNPEDTLKKCIKFLHD
jgi:hypothetical protein